MEIEAVRSQDQIGLRIQDTGLGMDKDEVPRIFDRFYRVDPSRGQTAGTGLGLSIAQWIIDEHQGSIEVMTRKGEGSTFIIWLPIYKPTSFTIYKIHYCLMNAMDLSMATRLRSIASLCNKLYNKRVLFEYKWGIYKWK